MKNRIHNSIFWIVAVSAILVGCNNSGHKNHPDIYAIPLMAGEPTGNSVILQARLTASDTVIYGDVHHADSIRKADIQGKEGIGRFLLSEDPGMAGLYRSAWLAASAGRDFIIRHKASGLKPGTRYYYRLQYGEDTVHTVLSGIQSFETLPGEDVSKAVSFVMVTGSNLDRFYLGGGFGKPSSQGGEAYTADDKYLGFPGYDAILKLKPSFFIGNGDNVYYDQPPGFEAKTRDELRAKWHRIFYQPRFRNLMAEIPTVWLKDDHDHRFDDSDTVSVHPSFGSEPSHPLGVETFLEQVPLMPHEQVDGVTYRTMIAGKLLQIWMVEGRDYRSPNAMPDGPDKTLWGEEQLKWLKNSLLESQADFKILVSPTPMVGPDDARKRDNHVNHDGFRTEGDTFFKWLKENDFLNKNFYIICGDRHWKYHSIHPLGFQEFSCGALVDQNSRIGRSPGDRASSDPEALISQPFSDTQPTGGFLRVAVKPGDQTDNVPVIDFDLFDQYGKLLYRYSGKAFRQP